MPTTAAFGSAGSTQACSVLNRAVIGRFSKWDGAA